MDFLTILNAFIAQRFQGQLPSESLRAAYADLETHPQDQAAQDTFINLLEFETRINLRRDLGWRNIQRRFAASASDAFGSGSVTSSDHVAPVVAVIEPAYVIALAEAIQADPIAHNRHPKDMSPNEWNAFAANPNADTCFDLFVALQREYIAFPLGLLPPEIEAGVISWSIQIPRLPEYADDFGRWPGAEPNPRWHVWDDYLWLSPLSSFGASLLGIEESARSGAFDTSIDRMVVDASYRARMANFFPVQARNAAIRRAMPSSDEARELVATNPRLEGQEQHIYVLSIAAYYEQLIREGSLTSIQDAIKIKNMLEHPEELREFLHIAHVKTQELIPLVEALRILSNENVFIARAYVDDRIEALPMSASTFHIAQTRDVFTNLVSDPGRTVRQQKVELGQRIITAILADEKLLQKISRFSWLWANAGDLEDPESADDELDNKLYPQIRRNVARHARNQYRAMKAEGNFAGEKINNPLTAVYEYGEALLKTGQIREYLRIYEATHGMLNTWLVSENGSDTSQITVINDFGEHVSLHVPETVDSEVAGRSLRAIEITKGILSPPFDEVELSRHRAAKQETIAQGRAVFARAEASVDPRRAFTDLMYKPEQFKPITYYLLDLLARGDLREYVRVSTLNDRAAYVVDRALQNNLGPNQVNTVVMNLEDGERTLLHVPRELREIFERHTIEEAEKMFREQIAPALESTEPENESPSTSPGAGQVFAPNANAADDTAAIVDKTKTPPAVDLIKDPQKKPEGEGYAATDNEPTLPKNIGGDPIEFSEIPLPARVVNDEVQELIKDGAFTNRGLAQLQFVLTQKSAQYQTPRVPNANGAVAVFASAQAANDAAVAAAAAARFTKALEVFFVLAK